MGWQAVGLAATIFIRSYNNFGVPAPDLAVAREHAQAILQEAGVNVVWIDCWAGARREAVETVDRCQEPVGSAIVLRLQKTKETDRARFVSMGFSLVGIPDAAPFLATVYVVGEILPRVSGYDPGVNHASFALEKRAGGHMFQMNISNGIGTHFGPIARGVLSNDDWLIGFNITRKFF